MGCSLVRLCKEGFTKGKAVVLVITVMSRIEPFETTDSIIIVENLTNENQIPKEFVGGVVKGIEDAALDGGINGDPVAKLKIFIIDGEVSRGRLTLSFVYVSRM